MAGVTHRPGQDGWGLAAGILCGLFLAALILIVLR